MTKDEALKMALSTLEEIHPGNMTPMAEKAWITAIEALREAMSQKDEQGPVAIGEEWTPCMKLPIVVHCREQKEGETHVSTREGITPVMPDDLIMRGVAGEEYPIGRELFDKTYTLLGDQK